MWFPPRHKSPLHSRCSSSLLFPLHSRCTSSQCGAGPSTFAVTMVYSFNYTSDSEWGRPSCDQSIKSLTALKSARQNLLDTTGDAARTARGYGSPTAGTVTNIVKGACTPYWEADWGESSSSTNMVSGAFNKTPKAVLTMGAKYY